MTYDQQMEMAKRYRCYIVHWQEKEPDGYSKEYKGARRLVCEISDQNSDYILRNMFEYQAKLARKQPYGHSETHKPSMLIVHFKLFKNKQ